MPRKSGTGLKTPRDAGFSLMEIVAAMAVLAVLAMAAGSMLIGSLGTTSSDRQRVRAANVAAQEIELVRSQMQRDPESIVLDLITDPVVSGTTYHVVRAGKWQSPTSFDALNLTVTVTWPPNMRGIKPVVNSSVLTTLGTGGDGSGGTVVVVDGPPPVLPDPLITFSPSCSLNTSLVTLTVTAQSGLLGLQLPLVSGTVIATPSLGSPCLATSLPVVAGVAVGSLPYGGWTFTASSGSASATATVTINSGLTAATLNILNSTPAACTSTGLVALTVTQTSYLGISTPVASGSVTGTRAASGSCSALTQTFPVVAGVAGGSLPYGDWTFETATPLGTATATATIGSASQVDVDLDTADLVCPTNGLVALAVNTKTIVAGVTTTTPLASGTVTATRTAAGSCPAMSQTFSVSGGVAGGSLPFGNWTFAVTSPSGGTWAVGSGWPTATVTSTVSVPVTVSLLGTCPSDGLVLLTVTKKVLGLPVPLVSGTVTATRTANGACQPAMTQSIPIVAGTALVSIPRGTWTFAVTSPGGLTWATGSAWPTAAINSSVQLGVTVAAQ